MEEVPNVFNNVLGKLNLPQLEDKALKQNQKKYLRLKAELRKEDVKEIKKILKAKEKSNNFKLTKQQRKEVVKSLVDDDEDKLRNEIKQRISDLKTKIKNNPKKESCDLKKKVEAGKLERKQEDALKVSQRALEKKKNQSKSLFGFHDKNKIEMGTLTTFNQKYNYVTNYNDHFETSESAIELIIPFLLNVMRHKKIKHRKDLKIYDPYYCQGEIKNIFKKHGFTNVYNENVDCYQDRLANPIDPDLIDVIVTNPPYSGTHKEHIMEYCLTGVCTRRNIQHTQTEKCNVHEHRVPFALLLPNYT